MSNNLALFRKGNKSALIAAIVNTIIAIIKGVAFFFTGNVAMFAETMHSLGDAANQYFVYIGSALSKKAPSDRYPNGFGRLVNLVLLGAVLVVGIMSYEAVKEGIHHILHPTEPSGIWISMTVLVIAVLLEFFVLYKASKEIAHDADFKATGLTTLALGFKHLNRAKPATKLVFMEDVVATLGGIFAIIGIVIAAATGWYAAEGIASVIIGGMMFYVVGRIFLDNAKGVLGEADDDFEKELEAYIRTNPEIIGIQSLFAMKEGEAYHIESKLVIDTSITVDTAIKIKNRIEEHMMRMQGVTDVIIEFVGPAKTEKV